MLGLIATGKGIPGFTAYSATKAAVRSFVRTWTAELRDRRIRVNAIRSGPIDTPIFEQQAPAKEGADQARAAFAAAVPFGRLGRPEEIAATIAAHAANELVIEAMRHTIFVGVGRSVERGGD
jgi:NAD(P)-dependent dehydrogenase (short-subunit alcohol dehydrogenase family)